MENNTVNTDYQVLAACLRIPEAIVYFSENLEPKDVGYVHGFKGIYDLYQAMLAYHKVTKEKVVDPVAFKFWLQNETDIYDSIGGESGYSDIYNDLVSIELPDYKALARIVEHRARKRRKLDHAQALHALIANSNPADENAQQEVVKLTEEINALYRDLDYNPLENIRTANSIIEDMDSLWELPPFIPTPFKNLNVALGYTEDGGIVRGGVHSVVAMSGLGKPLDVDTPVLTSSGEYKRLGDIRIGDRVINSKGQPDNVTKIFDQGVLKTIKITTRSGREVISALDHSFLTGNLEWVEAKDLRVGQKLYTPKSISLEEAKSQRFPEEARLIGYFLGDGATSSGNCNIVSFDDVTTEDIKHCAEKLGYMVTLGRNGRLNIVGKKGSGGWHKTISQNSCKTFLLDNELLGKTSYSKRVPAHVFSLDPEYKANLLAAYFACDGTVQSFDCYNPSGKRGSVLTPIIEYYSVSRALLSDIQKLLLSLNIDSSLKIKRARYKGEEHISWRLKILGRSVRNFIDQIKPYSEKQIRLDNWEQVIPDINPKQIDIPEDVAKDYWADSIVSIEDWEDKHCKCIEVENDHTFLANDLVVHNSTFVKTCCNYWLDKGYTVLFINFEEPQSHWDRVLMTQLTKANIYAEAALIDPQRRNLLTERFKDKLSEWGDRLMVRHDPDTLFFEDLEKWLRDVLGYGARKPDVVVIDTIQSMFTKTGGKARWGEFEQIMVRLEKLAKDMDAAFIITAQQNINATKEKRDVVNQSDMGGSVTITQKSTVTLFITPMRGSDSDSDHVSDRIMEIQIPKNRITGTAFSESPPLVKYVDEIKSYVPYDPSQEDVRYNIQEVELENGGDFI